MGSNNCSNVYVYAHTNPGPSSSPSIRGDSRFSYESHNEFRLFQLIGKAAVLWLTWVYLFRIILIAQLRKYSPPVFTSAKKKKKPQTIACPRCKSRCESHFSRIVSHSRVNIFDSLACELICKSGNFRVQFSISQVAFLAPIQEQSKEKTRIDLFSKDTYGKSLRIQRGNDVNISRISGEASQRKFSVTIALNFTDSFIPSRNPFRGTRHSLARDHIDYISTLDVDDALAVGRTSLLFLITDDSGYIVVMCSRSQMKCFEIAWQVIAIQVGLSGKNICGALLY